MNVINVHGENVKILKNVLTKYENPPYTIFITIFSCLLKSTSATVLPLLLRSTCHCLLTHSKEQSSSSEANRSQLVKKFPAFYGTRRFITAFMRARHLSLNWANSTQSIPPHPTSWRSILILSSHLRLGLPSGLYPSGFPIKTLHTPLLSPIRATCTAHLILIDLITRIIFGEDYRS